MFHPPPPPPSEQNPINIYTTDTGIKAPLIPVLLYITDIMYQTKPVGNMMVTLTTKTVNFFHTLSWYSSSSSSSSSSKQAYLDIQERHTLERHMVIIGCMHTLLINVHLLCSMWLSVGNYKLNHHFVTCKLVNNFQNCVQNDCMITYLAITYFFKK